MSENILYSCLCCQNKRAKGNIVKVYCLLSTTKNTVDSYNIHEHLTTQKVYIYILFIDNYIM